MNIHYTSVKGRRNNNEDRHNIILNIDGKTDDINKINLFGIYDGHGGIQVSEFLKRNIPFFYCHPELKPPFSKQYHYTIFNYIQKKLLKYKYSERTGSTCLLNIIYKYNNEYHMNIVNLGDCRLCIVYNDGSVKQITRDHKPDDDVEKVRIKKIGGEIYNDSEGVCRIGDLSVSRAFGDNDNAPYISQKPDIYYKKIINTTKYIVMACDGLWDVISNDKLYSLLEKYKNTKNYNLATMLADEALKYGTTDNLSIIVLEL